MERPMKEMLEIEIKAPCADLGAVKAKALSLGAEPMGTSEETDRYFSHPCRDFGETDEALRVRRKEGRARLTYKGPKLGDRGKTRYEKEVFVEDGTALEEVLLKLGFLDVETVRKNREMLRLGEVEICLDDVEGVGSFVELEIQGREREAGEEKLFTLARELGLGRFERKSYLEMKLEKISGA